MVALLLRKEKLQKGMYAKAPATIDVWSEWLTASMTSVWVKDNVVDSSKVGRIICRSRAALRTILDAKTVNMSRTPGKHYPRDLGLAKIFLVLLMITLIFIVR